jgi:hypothetical protein
MAKKALLAGVKPKDLDFTGQLPAMAGPVGHHADWPVFIQQGLELLRSALAKIGINLNTEDVPSPDALLERLIDLVEKSPKANWQKWLVLTALKWLHERVHNEPDMVFKALKGA